MEGCMPMIGKTLGNFECTALLGKGGMGEVYQAKDQKLGRDVAIKVLPEEFAKDTERVARFQREAKLLASLNHTNIASIHGLEESDGTHFLILELIEGDTLADQIKRGPIPVEEALKLALQITEALEAAHEKGVIHRDLKPANIKVTPDGKVKVLDFGLAKAFAGEQADLNLSNSPTLSQAATMQGVILGTAAYMPPEQARGKSVDRRADIWSFGCVLYEMLTGRSTFSGKDVTDILAAVIRAEPEWASLPANLHPKIVNMLDRCLNKDPKNRYSGISDARVDIQKVLADPSGVLVRPITEAEPQIRSRSIIPWAVAILGIVIVGAAAWYLKPDSPIEPRHVKRYYYELPADQGFTRGGETLVAVSADGTKIVYVAEQQLYLRNLDALHATPIPGTDEDPASPFFSPDGQWIGYYSFTDGQWKKVNFSGGLPMPLCDAPDPHGATWTTDKTILFGRRDGQSIMSVSEYGGEAEAVIEAGEGEEVYGPQVLPGGEWVLYTLTNPKTGGNRWDDAQIVVESIKTKERKILPLLRGSDVRYVPTGHIVYANGNILYAVTFDLKLMEVRGGSFPFAEGILRGSGQVTGTAHYGFSYTGALVYIPSDAGTYTDNRNLVWVSHDGIEEPLNIQPAYYSDVKISPDGAKLALAVAGNDQNIFTWDLESKNKSPDQLTFDDAVTRFPLWTQNSERILFGSTRENGREKLFWQAANGTGKAESLCSLEYAALAPYSWSEDGKTLLSSTLAGGHRNIAILPMEDEGECKPLLNVEYEVSNPRISPDGQWMSYISKKSGQWEVYVRPFPDVDGGQWQVSNNDGSDSLGEADPIWSPNGRELYYRNGDSVVAVEYETEPTFKKGETRILFPDPYLLGTISEWDISHDGKRFLMMKDAGTTDENSVTQPKINIVLNWFEELKQQVPVD